ncbi:PDCD5-related protein [Kickxella alabastrina]|uniref:PDCD5-related protein n=1 Tax=Kickxella alabastrina TaxID=61397 RepID=UPI00221EA14D|nr:PDCD5-related protein [Kickxella alabastrina]KAI7833271.1 PDCD5-related protein [Kickxella alabastrina]KAJ1943598.1 hypothetical protein GGF37_002571 [Kickxella alabastrina]
MNDSELEALRARRMAELQSQNGGANAGVGANAGADAGAESAAKSQQEEARSSMLSQALDNNARERLGRIAIVKADRARAIEDMILRMIRMGQIRKKITEDELKEMLEEINGQHHQETRIVYNRKGFEDDDDEEEYDF